MEVHQPLSADLLCSTCNQPYPSVEIYKEHYKSDFHRYNIKRKMVKLPPVTLEQFSTKLKETKNQPNTQFTCNQCRKTFGSANTLKQHAESKGHNPNMMIEPQEKAQKIKTVFEKDNKRCLFCQKVSESLEGNQSHMQTVHSFFIAQKEYCKNVSGLIEYLQEKIEVGHMCLTCQNKGSKDFQSGDAVRRHMTDRGHTFMKIDQGFQEYQKYYDFSRLFEEKLKEQTHIVPGIEFQKVKVIVDEQAAKLQDEEEGNNDDEWEDEDSEEENEEDWQDDEEEEEREKPIKEEGPKVKTKTYHIMKPTMTQNDELLLPNGKILGHRKYRHIYRQTIRLPNYFAQKLKMLTNGQHNSTVAIAERKSYLETLKAQKLLMGGSIREKKHWLRVGMANNLMKHYRCQNSL